MTRQECIDKIVDEINDMRDSDIASIWNDYCDSVGYGDDRVYCMDELDDLLDGMKPIDILLLGVNSSIFWSDDYFRFDGYGNIETISNLSYELEIKVVAEYCLDENECFGYSEILNILGDYLDEQEDEEDEEE